MNSVKERFENLLEFAPDEEVDQYAIKQLKKKLFSWKNDKTGYLCNIDYFVNGKEFTSLSQAIYKLDKLKKIKLKFIKPDLDGDWHFSKPTKEIMEKDGKGICKTLEYDPYSFNKWKNASQINTEKVMVRGFLTNYFVPISIKTKSQYHHAQDIPDQYIPDLKNLKELWSDFRKGVLPLEMRLCIYTKNERYAYIIDTIGDAQRSHPLNHISMPKEANREPIDYMHIDRILARSDISELLKNILETLFHTDELSLADVAHYFNMGQKVAQNSLKSLVSRGLVKKRKDAYYSVSIDGIRETVKSYD